MSTIRWPGPGRARHHDDYSWLSRVPDETFQLIGVMLSMCPPGASDFPPWAKALLERAKAEAEASGADVVAGRFSARRADPIEAIWHAEDLETALAEQWPRLTQDQREAMGTLARALGVPLPQDRAGAPTERDNAPARSAAPSAPENAHTAPAEAQMDAEEDNVEDAPTAPAARPDDTPPRKRGWAAYWDVDDCEPTEPENPFLV